MGLKIVEYNSCEKISCSETLPADVFLYLPASIIADDERRTIPASIVAADCVRSCGKVYYKYVITYDETLTLASLTCGDILGIICDGALVALINDIVDESNMAPRAPFPPLGRLTLTSGNPVPTVDVVGATTLYYTPYLGGSIWVYVSGVWTPRTFSQLSLALGTLTIDKNYDVFIYDNLGTLTLELSAAWANATTRTDAITSQDGFDVKAGEANKLLLGTIRSTSAIATEDSVTKRYVWNKYNRINRTLLKKEATNTWTYSSATFRPANNDATNRVEVVTGDTGSSVDLQLLQETGIPNGASCLINFGIDDLANQTTLSTLAPLGNGNLQIEISPGIVNLATYVPLGYHFYQWLESASVGTITFYGASNSGISGYING